SDPDALMLLAPSDHVIADPAAFASALEKAATAAKDGAIVLFGVPPTRPETGYGYLELGPEARAPVQPLAGFREKPGTDEARAMAESGRHLWNAGLFLCKARSLIAAFEAHAPDYLPPVTAAVEGAAPDLGFLRLAPGTWGGLEDRSLDYAVMEKAAGLSVAPLDAGWSDLGDWAAVGQHMAADAKGVSTSGPVTAVDCQDVVLRSESEALQLVGIGLRDVIAVAMDDAVLVADSSRAQEVREAVEALRAAGAPQADQLPRDYRPWGWYETLVSGDRFQVKRIVVEPGGQLSLQSHLHRAEHWVVVAGTAKVTIEETETLVTENESIYVPLGARHRLGNPGKVQLTLIEVQTGRYLGEDDITRYGDIYARK
ncbi:MAG: mannose-1-phosphate guanylyltransferase/mannose-6-phosphate isomerase, partial [Alphaproteobacteria bacterium]|nr:mannose-1-phosphate guanylyltransferase/mannose-6-phosphate isomerase [Alphaproteobacteria bacterium]